MCFNSGGGQSTSNNTTNSYQLNDNSTGNVEGNKETLNVVGSSGNSITAINTVSDSGAIDAGKSLGLAAIESGSKSIDTISGTFKDFANLLTSSSDKSIAAVQSASASQGQQANNTFTKLIGIVAVAVVAGILFLKK